MKQGRKSVIILAGLAAALGVWPCPRGSFVSKATSDMENYLTDYTYNGRVDSFTGEPIGTVSEDSLTLDNGDTRKKISEGMYFDFDLHAYVYPIEDGTAEITSGAADGMIVSDSVDIGIPDNVLATVYRNGNVYNFTGRTVSEVGEYTVTVAEPSKEQRLFSFTIIGKKTGMVQSYTLPTGFRITGATIDGEDAEYTRNQIPLEKEGYYEIHYTCERTGLGYTLICTVDHTPPQVVFEGVNEKNVAHGPVTIQGLEETDTVVIMREDKEVHSLTNNRLTQSGHYEVWVTDDAQNTAVSNFTIMVYLDSNGIIFFIVILAVIAGFIAYLVWQRKNLRVR